MICVLRRAMEETLKNQGFPSLIHSFLVTAEILKNPQH
ncbi:hypothetical protein D082_50990 (plasmid) [Synechocystis sp. PCC 6714]|nr:hypothetical protein D082_50990 [Synechocystis sp. PCC 6714]